MTIQISGITNSLRDYQIANQNLKILHFPVTSCSSQWNATSTGGTPAGAVANSNTARAYVRAADGTDSFALARVGPWGLNDNSANYTYIDWTKPLSLYFFIDRVGTSANNLSFFQLKEITTRGILAERGIGVQITGFTLIGEAYGTSRGTTATLITLTASQTCWVEIRLDSTGAEFFINSISGAKITAANTFPSVTGNAAATIMASTDNNNGGAPGGNTDFGFGGIRIVQRT